MITEADIKLKYHEEVAYVKAHPPIWWTKEYEWRFLDESHTDEEADRAKAFHLDSLEQRLQLSTQQCPHCGSHLLESAIICYQGIGRQCPKCEKIVSKEY